MKYDVPFVSIIIPIYNAEKYIERCLQSILNQTLVEIEVIIVNDGSIDNSFDLCKKYEEKDKRIVLINQENKGAGAARNKGIEIARGKYIGFVDIDDYIEKQMYEIMYDCGMKNNADIVICGVLKHDLNGKISSSYLPFKHEEVLNIDRIRSEIVPLLISPENEGEPEKIITRAMWCRLFNHKWLKKSNIWFEDSKNGQDAIFTLNATCKANTLVVAKQQLYHYCNDNKVSLSKGYTADRFQRLLDFEKKYEQILQDAGLINEFVNQMNQLRRHDVFWATRVIVSSSNNQSFFRKIFNIKKLLQHDKAKVAFRDVDISELPFQQKVLYSLFKRKMAIALYFSIKLKYK